jgi:hypothetical protein
MVVMIKILFKLIFQNTKPLKPNCDDIKLDHNKIAVLKTIN